MNESQRKTILFGVLIAMLCGMALWSYGRFADARRRAVTASQDLHRCQTLAEKIEKLSSEKIVAADKEVESATLTQSIENAVAKAGLKADSLLRIAPQPARRLKRTAYRQKPTRLELRDVRMPQLVRFLYGVSEEQSQLNVQSIRLDAPRGQEESEIWNAELTLAYLIYEPVKSPKRGGRN